MLSIFKWLCLTGVACAGSSFSNPRFESGLVNLNIVGTIEVTVLWISRTHALPG